MIKNIGSTDSRIRIFLGIIFLILALFVSNTSWLSVLLFILGVVSIFTGFSGFCALYTLFGINTAKK
ncbi:MAG: DUF2892 domain-containing protein [Dissulfurispiraceae bacterium]|jgi:hypothetical protein|nr:DUF2892 domain-containing protein [Dissulfurispiraceae bacterium]